MGEFSLNCCFGEPRSGGMRRTCDYMGSPITCAGSSVLKLWSFKDPWRIFFLTATSVDQPHSFSTILVQMLSWRTSKTTMDEMKKMS